METTDSGSWQGLMVRVSVNTSVKFLVPYRFSKHSKLNTFGAMSVFFDREVDSVSAPEGSVMLCVQDSPSRFLVFHNGGTYISVKKFYGLYHDQHQ